MVKLESNLVDVAAPISLPRNAKRHDLDTIGRSYRRWGRWQHVVDYRPFKSNRLIRKLGIVIPDELNEYGMQLVQVGSPRLADAAV